MNIAVKIILYILLIGAAIFLGSRFYSFYNGAKAPSQETAPAQNKSKAKSSNEPASTNLSNATVSNQTNTAAMSTNPPTVTNTPIAAVVTNTNVPVSTNLSVTNISVVASNSPKTNPGTSVANEASKIYTAGGSEYSTTPQKSSLASIVAYFGALIAVLICLGVMLARDFTNVVAGRTVEFLFNDDGGEASKDPEYEQAEQVWANGEPLEAIQLMRDYLKEHPREQYVALRIAEIYEKDLHNDLAAALEYEEVLKKKLPPERWGWAAIHLCNVYSRNGRTEQAVELLRRIDTEYPKTAPASKARKRLAMYASGDPNALAAEDTSSAPDPDATPENPAAPPAAMPPGFRPKS